MGSRLNYLDVWSIEHKAHVKKIELVKSSDESKNHLSEQSTNTIKDCLVLPGLCYDNKIVLVLAHDGRLDVYNIESGQLVANLNSFTFAHNHSQVVNEQKLVQIVCPTNSARFFCALSQDGCIQVYDLDCSFVKSMKVFNIKKLFKTQFGDRDSFY